MRAVIIHQFGGPESMIIDTVPIPLPAPDEVRLRVAAIGLNRAELMVRSGNYPLPKPPPVRIGFEASGRIDAIGAEVKLFEVGERVAVIPGTFNATLQGTYADFICVPAEGLIRLPIHLDDTAGAAIGMGYFTAWGLLKLTADPAPGDPIFINAAASSVGIPLLQICRKEGYRSIAATRNPDKLDQLKLLGADEVLDSGAGNITRRLLNLTEGKGVQVILDPVGGSRFEELLKALGPRGKAVIYSSLDSSPLSFSPRLLMSRNASLSGFLIFSAVTDPSVLTEGKNYIQNGIDSGEFLPEIARTFPLDEVADAHRFMESNRQIGKIVLIP
ncbi:zinc-dependent alcohol dehydrogenase family protein [bacterium]|nr:zinc-dependent alcohol dehydrogenase family protein [candidate division CSSED10-310 bacterium]